MPGYIDTAIDVKLLLLSRKAAVAGGGSAINNVVDVTNYILLR